MAVAEIDEKSLNISEIIVTVAISGRHRYIEAKLERVAACPIRRVSFP
jgi:hypothetical protein